MFANGEVVIIWIPHALNAPQGVGIKTSAEAIRPCAGVCSRNADIETLHLAYKGVNIAALYVVATPIGNLEDITLRAVRVLRDVKLIAAEDTRKTRRLLTTYDIHTRLTSYHEHNKMSKLDYLLEQLRDNDVALVSEAGMPGLNDPGYELIGAAISRGFPVIPVPGPSVVITALVVSGLPTDRFLYLGFLPRKQGERKRLLESVVSEPSTLIALEAPHRVQQSLQDLMTALGDRKIAVCRELTKLHEEVFRGALSQARRHFSEPRGEFTLVIEGNRVPPSLDDKIVKAKLKQLLNDGATGKTAVAQLTAQSGLSKREVYKLWLKLKAEK